MERCRICDTPLEEGFITGRDLAWAAEERPARDVPDARERSVLVWVSASRCPSCQIGVFSYEDRGKHRPGPAGVARA